MTDSDDHQDDSQVDDDWSAEGDDQDDVATTDADDADAEGDAADDDGDDGDDGDDAGDRPRANSEPDYVPEGDDRALDTLDFLSRVIKEMEVECEVHLRRPGPDADESEINLEISGRDAGRIIGKKGMVLAALQFIVHRMVNRPGLERRHVLVDAEGYRSRRDDSLALMARRLGKQAVEQGKIITFEPMNPRDRRVVHLALAKFDGVITKSDGEGDDRRVQIIPVRR